jgi:hypothetical protein
MQSTTCWCLTDGSMSSCYARLGWLLVVGEYELVHPLTRVYEIGFKLEVREPTAHRPWYRELCATL